MRACIPYLNFDGNAREAMTFYKNCQGSGAELTLQTFGEAHSGGHSVKVADIDATRRPILGSQIRHAGRQIRYQLDVQLRTRTVTIDLDLLFVLSGVMLAEKTPPQHCGGVFVCG